MKKTLWLTSICALLASCGSSSPSPPPEPLVEPPDAGEDVEDVDVEEGDPAAVIEASFCRPLAEASCEVARGCGCAALSAECAEARTALCMEELEALIAAVGQGEVVFRADLADRCVGEALAAQSGCEVAPGRVIDARCPQVVATSSPLGAACGEQAFCASGDGQCRDGRCVPLPKLGEPCDFVCGDDSYCVLGVCAAPIAAGGPCVEDDQCVAPLRCLDDTCGEAVGDGGGCLEDADCVVGARCQEGACADRIGQVCGGPGECGVGAVCALAEGRVCRPQGVEGEACEGDSCDGAHFCDRAEGVCRARPLPGAPCSDGVHCAPGAACNLETGVCGPIPGEGEPCGLGSLGPLLCAEGLGCLAGVCGPMPGEEEECAIDNRCAGDLGCDFTPEGSLCRPRRGVGGACEADHICAPGTFCDFGELKCTPHLEVGARCTNGNECGPEGSCLPDGRGRFACAPMPDEGDACFLECGQGLTCVNVADPVCALSVCF